MERGTFNPSSRYGLHVVAVVILVKMVSISLPKRSFQNFGSIKEYCNDSKVLNTGTIHLVVFLERCFENVIRKGPASQMFLAFSILNCNFKKQIFNF